MEPSLETFKENKTRKMKKTKSQGASINDSFEEDAKQHRDESPCINE